MDNKIETKTYLSNIVFFIKKYSLIFLPKKTFQKTNSVIPSSSSQCILNLLNSPTIN